jgi:hypothetical protein
VALVTIVGLLAVCGWLAARLLSANKDNEALRKRVEHLKRKILLER